MPDISFVKLTGPTGPTGATGATGPGYGATSSTSLLIATGSKSFTTQAGLAYSVGARVRASSFATPTNYMEGLVASYSSTTLVLTVDTIGGSGTLNDWRINLAGNVGATGATGSTGATGPTGPGYTATSTTSLLIAVASKTFTTQAGLAYSAGARVRASSAANPTVNYMSGVVTSYSGTSLVVSVDTIGGSGTFADWNLNVAGNVGATGATGPAGTAGYDINALAYNASTSQSIPDNTQTALTFDTDEYDTSAIHDTSTNPSRFTVPASHAGKWACHFQVCFAFHATGQRLVRIKVNGVTVASTLVQAVTVSGANTIIQASRVVVLAVGDYVEGFALQDSGGALNAVFAAHQTFGSIRRIA